MEPSPVGLSQARARMEEFTIPPLVAPGPLQVSSRLLTTAEKDALRVTIRDTFRVAIGGLAIGAVLIVGAALCVRFLSLPGLMDQNPTPLQSDELAGTMGFVASGLISAAIGAAYTSLGRRWRREIGELIERGQAFHLEGTSEKSIVQGKGSYARDVSGSRFVFTVPDMPPKSAGERVRASFDLTSKGDPKSPNGTGWLLAVDDKPEGKPSRVTWRPRL